MKRTNKTPERVQPGTVGLAAGESIRLDAAVPLTLGGIWQLLKSRSVRVELTIDVPKIRRSFFTDGGGKKRERMAAVAVVSGIAFKAHENMRVGHAQPNISHRPASGIFSGQPAGILIDRRVRLAGFLGNFSAFTAENAMRTEPIVITEHAVMDVNGIRNPLKDPGESDWLRDDVKLGERLPDPRLTQTDISEMTSSQISRSILTNEDLIVAGSLPFADAARDNLALLRVEQHKRATAHIDRLASRHE